MDEPTERLRVLERTEVVEFSLGRAKAAQLAVDGVVTVNWAQQELNLSGLWTNQYIPAKAEV